VTSAKAFTSKSRPRAVKVAAGGAPYKLTQARRSARKSVWRSARLTAGQIGALSSRRVQISVRTAAGTVTRRRSLPPAPAAPAPAPGPGGSSPAPWVVPPVPTPPSGPVLTSPGLTLTRDDAAGRVALNGDLVLERTVGPDAYDRIFLYSKGVFRTEEVSGEVCDFREGTWAFAEGYTFPENGGGVIVLIATVTNGQVDRALLSFLNSEPNSVAMGTAGVRYERNLKMPDQC
jgi:hypothetical protein